MWVCSRWLYSLARYSRVLCSCGSLAITRSSPPAAASSMNRAAASSNVTSAARSSKARRTREANEVTRIATMKIAAILMPSGRSITFATRVYANTAVIAPKPIVAARCPRLCTATADAKDADSISTSTPVAYAPLWSSTFASNQSVMNTAAAMNTSTNGRTARVHSGAMP